MNVINLFHLFVHTSTTKKRKKPTFSSEMRTYIHRYIHKLCLHYFSYLLFTERKQHLTEIDHKEKDERRGSYDGNNDNDSRNSEEETTHKSVHTHMTERTEVEITTAAAGQIKPECQHVNNGEYNIIHVDTS